MKKIRIYELAKNLDVPAKTVIQELDKMGIKVKSHMSSVDADFENKLNDVFNPNTSKNKTKKEGSTENNKQKYNNKNKNFKKNSHKKENDDESEVDSKAFKHENRQRNKNQNTPKKNKRNRKNSKKVEIDEDHFKNLQKTTPRLKNKYKKKEETEKVDPDAPIEIPGSITVADLAEAIDVTLTDLMGKLISYGIMASQNEELSFENAQIISLEFGKEVVQMTEEDLEEDMMEELDFEDKESSLKKRPPVVTVMGHVDHGKTSLLDSIRNTAVTRGEAGGITQHIGASVVNVNNEKIVFLDTPGHEAFTAMRSRGAQVTDLAILVVAADDGVMPQTIEAINHAKAAEVPIIVAINKMDKPEANVERIKQELADNDLMPDDWGGDAICMPVSAKTGEGIDDLLEMILTVSEMEELKANPNRKAIGTVIEAQLDKGRGPTATVLIQKGTLKTGDIVVSGTTSGRIRAMFDDKGKNIKKAGPSFPAQILGLSDVPESGDTLYAVKDERTARGYADKAKEVQKEDMIKSSSNINLDDLFNQISSGDIKDLNIIIKTDVRGTIDAVKQSFEKLSNEEVKVNIIHGAVGGVTDSDVNLAAASNALIIGFNVRPSQSAIELANYENVEIRTYRVIYEAIEDLKNAIKGMLAPKLVEEVTGRAEIRAVFKVPNVGSVAGIYVTSGKILRNASVRLIRDDIVIHEGEISSLKRFKDDTKELATGYEGGLGIENYNDIKEGDVIESFVMKEVAPK
ncbi:translation initiation factor IF-2 [Mediannikoviicoccus vaginalis]|uniref:translation initiation factor IF-2 n=1 Tax=Mediannikoviicoccus vaginalis TaxID=2899727 RepID=UPI001F023F28|nr:translation initiation factor IF-2 [Mediannikoviicoccus vaginalis]